MPLKTDSSLEYAKCPHMQGMSEFGDCGPAWLECNVDANMALNSDPPAADSLPAAVRCVLVIAYCLDRASQLQTQFVGCVCFRATGGSRSGPLSAVQTACMQAGAAQAPAKAAVSDTWAEPPAAAPDMRQEARTFADANSSLSGESWSFLEATVSCHQQRVLQLSWFCCCSRSCRDGLRRCNLCPTHCMAGL